MRIYAAINKNIRLRRTAEYKLLKLNETASSLYRNYFRFTPSLAWPVGLGRITI